MQGSNAVRRNEEPELINIRRNPYLVDYEERRRQAVPSAQQKRNVRQYRNERVPQHRQPGGSRAAAQAKRRKQVRRQRAVVGLFACGIILIFGLMLLKKGIAGTAAERQGTDFIQKVQEEIFAPASGNIQGIPAEKYNAHPDWTEDFLTPNEYSRPGEPLETVKNIFVHYTANPGTSAAQNRSYFEQQKDMHQASVSSHFIIGYDGEILQCLPLDEIGYAVQTRNYDSISIECCFKAKDGSFTQETYDSLIALLAWLTDAYGLDTEDILRHYDCGGKKCPLYYTEHPDAWERLKDDVVGYPGA